MTNNPMSKARLLIFFQLAVFFCGIGTAIVSLRDAKLMNMLYLNGSYYAITLLFVCWLWSLIKNLRSEGFSPALFLTAHAKGLAAAALICLLIGISVQSNMRVLSDEANTLSVSRSMTYSKTVHNITEASYHYRNLYVNKTAGGIEKHRLLFSYLTHWVHSVSGYRAENVFIVNGLVLFALLCLLYVVLSAFVPFLWVVSCMVLVAAQPIVSQCATSGGVDLTNAFFICVMLYTLWRFLETPCGVRFELLWLTLLMLSHTRQESILFFTFTVAALAAAGRIKTAYFKESLACAATFFIILPVIWQTRLVAEPYEQKASEAAFSAANFLSNNLCFFKTLLRYDFFLPYVPYVNMAGIAGLLYILFLRKRNDIKQSGYPLFLAIATGNIVVFWVVMTSFYRGVPDHPSDARYFVFIAVLLSVAAGMFIRAIKLFDRKEALFLVLSVVTFALYHPQTVENRFTNAQILTRKYNYTVDYLKKNAGKNILLIVDRPGHYIIHEYGAMGFEAALKTKPMIAQNLKNNLYEKIYVIQDMNQKSGQPAKGNGLDADFVLKTVYQIKNLPEDIIRISELSSILPEEKIANRLA